MYCLQPCPLPSHTTNAGSNARPAAVPATGFETGVLDGRYLDYFDRFNRRQFFEAHEVLEELWLLDRRGADGDFFKGLIQLAGAFVHIQKSRRQPAVALFNLAAANLRKYPAPHFNLDVAVVLALIARWVKQLENAGLVSEPDYPRLALQAGGVA